MAKKLVIVESPAKARTLSKILGSKYAIKASLGHIRDLPKGKIGIDIDNDFKPQYVVPRQKSKTVNDLKNSAKEALSVYLATDPDREGESISWHLMEAMKLNKDKPKVYRVSFHEITKEAVNKAFDQPRIVDMNLVNAQQARRILDRLVGYKLSPLLWRKIQRGLSAGRVQSATVRIIVDREREIQNFIASEYWSIEAELAKQLAKKQSFRAMFAGFKDGTKIEISSESKANSLRDELETAVYSVGGVVKKDSTRQSAPPFTTSTLQQEAWRKLRFTAKRTMIIAQQLYEGLSVGDEGSVGLITYMRTDSTHMAVSAVAEIRDYVTEKYGSKYIPPKPRSFSRKNKWTQEAHEAVRPTKVYRDPDYVRQYLKPEQYKLYELIWKRAVASQMASAVISNTMVEIDATPQKTKNEYRFRSSSSAVKFPGFIAVYSEEKDEDAEEEKAVKIPLLAKGEALSLLELVSEQHFTQPPPRYTEASLIKALEQKGIGRPSTYAPTISTIQDRNYISKDNGRFIPNDIGFIVNDLLIDYFPDIVNLGFTAKMEEDLDLIANGKKEWVSVLKGFYFPFDKTLQQASETIEKIELPVQESDEMCPECGKVMLVKTGRYGEYLGCSDPECKKTMPLLIKSDVPCPVCGKIMVIKKGRFGKYLACSDTECKKTMPLSQKTDITCPECSKQGEKGELLERYTKKNRRFYGCSRYPECRFTTWQTPVNQPCPNCGNLLTLYRNDLVKCVTCDYKGRLSEFKSEVLP
jgi:DNA topoisomerase-1